VIQTTQIPCFYAPSYCPAAPDPNAAHFARIALLQQMLAKQSHWRWCAATPISMQALEAVHAPHYVRAMCEGIAPLARSANLAWSQPLIDAAMAMVGGQLQGASTALAHGVALNLAIGFHHAFPAYGGGYCVFNGLAAVAALNPTRRILVLDCDEHGGDGTAAFANQLANLSTISIFGTRFGLQTNANTLALRVPVSEHTDQTYLETLAQALDHALVQCPDLVLYQAGVDMHQHDPKATLKLSDATLKRRDRMVFSTLKAAGIPLLCSFAGGYQSPQTIAALYFETTQLLAATWLR
jgi:acetoin utilization deacetylase AcuC-like enzyme